MFDSIGVIEKGIERIYHHLLKHVRIENLKEVSEQYDLTLKRVYKICSVLSDLGLVQIFDRPMKILLATPIVPIWQKLINKRIEQFQNEFNEKKRTCEATFEDFIQSYSPDEEITPEPVEFVNFEGINFENIYYPLYAKDICKIAIGIKYETPVSTIINKISNGTIKKEEIEPLIKEMKRIKENLNKIILKVIINNELLNELINGNEYKILTENVKEHKFEFKDLDVRITEEHLSNFSLTESRFIQPCFDPVNKLLGLFVSRDENIYNVFDNKFKEFFETGIPINEYLKNQKLLRKGPLSKSESFVLCLL